MAVAIRCENLSKSYGKVEAVKNVNLTLEEDKIYGLLGRNGAGKSTFTNLIASQIIRDRGSINIFNEEVFENTKALENICLVKEKELPMEDRRVKKIFESASVLYKNWDEDYKEFLVKEFNLDVKKKYKNLSRGNKSIAQLIIGLSSRAKITIFDEPSLGLDAAVREKFYDILLKDYEENKRTIILSTHLIDEVSNLFEEVIIMNKGEIIIKEDIEGLLDKAHFLRGREEVILPLIKDKELVYKEHFGATSIMGIIGVFKAEELNALKDNNIEISPMSLQKLFIYITQKLNS